MKAMSERSVRGYLSAAFVAAVGVVVTCCAVPGIVERGPQVLAPVQTAVPFVAAQGHQAKALSRPLFAVSPAAPLARQYAAATVLSDETHPDDTLVAEVSRRRRLVLKVGESIVNVDYASILGRALPLPKGEPLQVRYYPTTVGTGGAGFADAVVEDGGRRGVFVVGQRRRGEPDLRVGGLAGWAFLVRDGGGKLLVALFSGSAIALVRRAHTPIAMAPGVGVEPAGGTLYESVARMTSGCQSVVRHRAASMEERWPRGGLDGGSGQRGTRFEGYPGTWRTVLLHGGRFHWVLWDASDSPADRCPGVTGAGHLSFALVADTGSD